MRARVLLLLVVLGAGCIGERDFAWFDCVRGGAAPPHALVLRRADAHAIDPALPGHLDRIVADGNASFELSGRQGGRLVAYRLPNATGEGRYPYVFDYEGALVSCGMAVP